MKERSSASFVLVPCNFVERGHALWASLPRIRPNRKTTSTKQPIIGAWLRSGTRDPLRQLVVIVATRVKSYNEISAFSYTVERDGTLTANDPVNDGVLVDFARANNIRVIPTMSCTWDSTHIVNILKSQTLRARHIEAIMQVARSPLIDGIDIDYENLPASSRQGFTDFITLLRSTFTTKAKR